MYYFRTFILILYVLSGSAQAMISYCPGTQVAGYKSKALQYVVTRFAEENNCIIGNNCLLNFDQIKYSIAWVKPCPASATKGNDPLGSTFICDAAMCYPYGFNEPVAGYQE